MKRLVPALVAVAVLPLLPATAQAGLNDECFGRKPNVVGTNGSDVIHVRSDEAGASITVNGKERFIEWGSVADVVISAGDGKDKIHFDSDGGGTAAICAGKGDDTVDGDMIRRLSTDSGYDRVTMHLQCWLSPDIYGADAVKLTYDASGDPSECN